MTDYEGWHFLRLDRRLGYGDNREVRAGETLTVDGPLVICERGLHAAPRALDALIYAPGPIACRVRLSGEVLVPPEGGQHADKMCATERTVLAMVDATEILREFVRDTLVVRQPHLVSLFERAGLHDAAATIGALDMATAPLTEIERVCTAAWAVAQDAAWAAWDAAQDAARDAAWAALNERLEARLRAAMEDTRA